MRLRGLLLALPPVLVIAVFIGVPIVTALAYSLGHTGGPNSVIASIAQDQHVSRGGAGTLGAYRAVFGDRSFRRDLWVTVWVSSATVVLVLLLAWGVALYQRLSQGRVARTLTALSVVPLFVPVVIASYAILACYAPYGLVRTVLYHLGWHSAPTLSYTMATVLIGQVWVNVPFGVLMIASGLNAVPNALIEAARDAGASPARTVRSVLVPLNSVPTTIVVTFTGINVLGSFTVPYLTGPASPNLLGPAMTEYFQNFNRPQQAVVMAVVVFVLAAGLGAAYVTANVRSARRTGLA